MAIILLEGLDKTGKTTVAEYFRQRERFEYVHMTAPAKWHTRDTYFAEMLHVIALTAGKKVIIDRTWWGEMIWPYAYNRQPLLSLADCQLLTRVAEHLHALDARLFYMHDPDKASHQARMRQFKEPTYDYDQVYSRYMAMAELGFFEKLTFQDAEKNGWKV